MLADVASAEPGPWTTARTPYLRDVMDALGPQEPCERIIFQAGAQLGKTECGNNFLGYTIHYAPAPILMVQPTVEVAKRVSKQRIAPMIASSPVLRDRVAEPRSRDSGNTVLVKEFDGGLLIITGANSTSGLRSMPIKNLFLDEVDEYPGDIGGQGDPVSIAEKRTSTFAYRKVYMPSTPTIRGLSRVENEYRQSDQRRYFVPCLACGHMDVLTWSGYLDFVRGKDGGHHRIEWEGRPDSARMVCASCGARTSEAHKTAILNRGEWRATAESDGSTIGFHLSSLYSPLGWRSWADCAREFLLAKNDPFKLKAWVNTVLAETWEERGDVVELDTLAARREDYGEEVPAAAGVLVAAVDVQGDRLEVVVKAFGAGEESWLIAFQQLFGDPASTKTWQALDEFLAPPFKHQSGKLMRPECVVIDSGGLHTEQVYRYVKARPGRRIFAVKGGSYTGRPLVERPSMRNSYRVPLFVLCVDTGKDVVMSRLGIHTSGPGYMHLPLWADEEYLAQLTAERAVRKYVKGRGAVREWVKTRDRNEAFDLEVYSLAALYILGQRFVANLDKRTESLNTADPSPESEAAPAAKQRPSKSWVSRW